MTWLKLHYHHHYHKHGYHRPNRLTLTSLIQVCCSYDCSSKNVHCCRVLEKFTCFLPPSSVELVHSLVKRVDRLESQCSLLTNHVLMLQMVSDKLPVLAFACMLFFNLRDMHHPVFNHRPVVQHGTHHHPHSAHCLNQQLHLVHLHQVLKCSRASYYPLPCLLHRVHLFALLRLHSLCSPF